MKAATAGWGVIKPMLPIKPRGIHRVDGQRVLKGIFSVLRSGRRGGTWPDLRAFRTNLSCEVSRSQAWPTR